MVSVMKRKVYAGAVPMAFRGLVLRKHDIAYHRRDECDFIQTEEPYWLDEAYSSAISDKLKTGSLLMSDFRAITGWSV